MIRIRHSQERGLGEASWLKSRHTFSFAQYYDPAQMGFGPLRVINEDWIAPGSGFSRHPHADMEIITYVIEGALQHEDSLGHGSAIHPGEVQMMRAGTGITHSEYNGSDTNKLHLLQIWILPSERGLKPGYQQKKFPLDSNRNQFCLVVSPDGKDESLEIHQEAQIYAGRFDGGAKADLTAEGNAWVQVVKGELKINGTTLQAGDGAALENERQLHFQFSQPSELLVFCFGRV